MLAVVEKPLDPVAVRLGEGLRAARSIAGINQRELARLLDVPPNYISRWETGVRRLELETIEKAEHAMDVQPGTIFRLSGYVDDGQLIDLGSLKPGVRLAVEAILRAFDSIDRDSGNGTQRVD